MLNLGSQHKGNDERDRRSDSSGGNQLTLCGILLKYVLINIHGKDRGLAVEHRAERSRRRRYQGCQGTALLSGGHTEATHDGVCFVHIGENGILSWRERAGQYV